MSNVVQFPEPEGVVAYCHLCQGPIRSTDSLTVLDGDPYHEACADQAPNIDVGVV